MTIPLLFRTAYHFDVATKLDLYLVGKLGLAFGAWNGDTRDMVDNYANASVSTPIGFAFGIDLGVSYYLTPRMGLFAEVGFDRYGLSSEISAAITSTNGSGRYASTTTGNYSYKVDAPFSRFITFGISIK
ncbi:hypothetical protein FACS1894137_02140 [Spirochaetia bacterium]|nr:hypothetical protein FACS1894137_02140 [Spirochaetia bacterium]